jgi:hypothetical protein
MSRFGKTRLAVLLAIGLLCAALYVPTSGMAKAKDQNIVQAQIVLTVSESKRLIAKAVAQMPIVKEALKNGIVIIAKGTTCTYVAEEILGKKIPHGIVIIAKGTTCTYVAEEILGKKIPHGAYILGRTFPEKGGKRLKDVERIGEVVLVKGKHRDDLSLGEAVRMLKPGDVVIKGANALDHENKLAAGIVGSSSGGTTGKILPYVGSRKAHLVIPVGLEKQVSGSVLDIVRKMQEPVDSLNDVYSMFLFTGHIVTELEALNLLADVSVFQAAAGGIGGAEGSVRLICRGPRQKVQKALRLAEKIQGEPPFVE